MSELSIVAPHAKRPGGDDKIFAANAKANAKSAEIGFEKVINATVGALLNDDGSLSVLQSVMAHLRGLPDAELAAYAPIAGLPEFREAAIKAAFGPFRPSGFIEAAATPGGSGAIRNTLWNYANPGDAVLTSDWYWGPYKTQAEANGRRLETFTLFNRENQFNLSAFREKAEGLLKEQDRLVILLNSPAHNPTGYSLSDAEWDGVLETVRTLAENLNKRIILFSDIAYIDFAEGDASRSFMKKFGGLPENVLVVVAFSMSKAYTLYGLRSGAMICVSSSRYAADEFLSACQFSNRGTWSNGTRGAQKLLADIYSDPDLKRTVEEERAFYARLLAKRAEAFMTAAREADLDICPYRHGFFITIPCADPDKAAQALQNRNVFAVALERGLRFAVCSVSEEKCRRAPAIIKETLETL